MSDSFPPVEPPTTPDRAKRYRNETERFLAEHLAATRPTAWRIRALIVRIMLVLLVFVGVAAFLYLRE